MENHEITKMINEQGVTYSPGYSAAMTDNRFQVVLDEMNAGRLSGGTHWDVIKEAITLAARHAEAEAAADWMATSLWAIRNFDGRRNRRHFNGLIDEVLARWRKSRQAVE